MGLPLCCGAATVGRYGVWFGIRNLMLYFQHLDSAMGEGALIFKLLSVIRPPRREEESVRELDLWF